MRKRTGSFYFLLPVVLALGLYFVFYDRITCKPTDAGFWIIFVVGLSTGVALVRFIQRPAGDKKNNQ
jgi:Na+-transporting NADH:ubiquinone oxidoreductase subunit NqrB